MWIGRGAWVGGAFMVSKVQKEMDFRGWDEYCLLYTCVVIRDGKKIK